MCCGNGLFYCQVEIQIIVKLEKVFEYVVPLKLGGGFNVFITVEVLWFMIDIKADI